nr:MAG TPA: hypothetical protein [Crassvirales sp.]
MFQKGQKIIQEIKLNLFLMHKEKYLYMNLLLEMGKGIFIKISILQELTLLIKVLQIPQQTMMYLIFV